MDLFREDDLGAQKICSQIVFSDHNNPVPVDLPRTFLLFGQRFTVDSHLLSNVVFDRIIYEGKKVERLLPSPLDVWFGLGNNHVTQYLKSELETYNYSGNLNSMRRLIDSYPKEFWSMNVYNLWLSALKTLNGEYTDKKFPEPMQTSAYQDKILHTQLASWAQLRHDTILYTKQSFSAVPLCEYPAGYIEPFPELYEVLESYAAKSKEMLQSTQIADHLKYRIVEHFTHFEKTMRTLKEISIKELKEEELNDYEEKFIKNTILKKEENVVCATITTFAGWYPELFFKGVDDSVKRDHIVADIHTNPAEQEVLHVGIGDVNLMIFTNQPEGEDPAAYVGPVYSYYEYVGQNMTRLNDDEWSKKIQELSVKPPAWTSSFMSR